ncbi:MAG: DUF1232 domain-containing protein, partial [Candidatus Zixiibacteriota bacterium]
MTKLRRWRKIGNDIKFEAYCLYLAAKDPRTPWYTKALVVCVVGYALSPLDLIPDFIPILGYLDDLIIVSFGMALAVRLVPRDVLEDCRHRAPLTIDAAVRAAVIAAGIVVFLWIVT